MYINELIEQRKALIQEINDAGEGGDKIARVIQLEEEMATHIPASDREASNLLGVVSELAEINGETTEQTMIANVREYLG
ncbi:MAG: hypothetical protein K8F25_15110 [Fimbriimonadaceae bacterium]|nr:hypothetical protein [Alphaproteobacteria bacterium]